MIKMPPETVLHAYFSDRFAHQLRLLLGNRAQVREGRPIALPDQSTPVPDIAVVQPLNGEYLDHHPFPDQIVWLVDYTETDADQELTIQSAIYATAEIQEYWVINLRDGQLTVFCFPVAGQYQNRRDMTEGTIAPLAFLDVVIPVERLFTK